MTFKHVKFEDSAIMRSLEKVAREKGLIKEEDLIKKASKSIDLSPTPVLLVNLLKLANGLRDKGYDDAAAELENKAIAYKQAQSLYETSKEKGEDLIDAAHPKGSHKLEGVEGDALFETILDQHLADLEVVEKKPTGKLASSRDILKAVRIVLAGTDEENENVARGQFLSIVSDLTNLVARVMRNEDLSDWTYHSPMNFGNLREDEEAGTGVATGTTKGHMEVLTGNLNELSKKGPSQETIREIQKNINTLTSLIRDADHINPVARGKYTSDARTIYSRTPKVLEALRGEGAAVAPVAPVTIPTVNVTSGPLGKMFGQITALKSKLNLWKSFRSISKNREAMNWINEEIKSLDDIDQRYDKVPEDQEAAAAPQMQRELNEEVEGINEFEGTWIKPAGNA